MRLSEQAGIGYLPLTGGTMLGDIDMGGYDISNAAEITATTSITAPQAILTDFYVAGNATEGSNGYAPATKSFHNYDAAGDGSVWVSKYAPTSASNAIASTAAETDFSLTYTFPANSLIAGTRVRIRASATYATTATPTLTIKQYFGTNTVGSTGAVTCANNETNGKVIVELEGVVRSTTSAYWQGWLHVYNGSNTALATIPISAAVVIDTAGAIVVKISAQWSASSSSNTITLQTFFISRA
jgi:hypothetical protein